METKDLEKALRIAKAVAPTRSSMPVLKNIRIAKESGVLSVYAYDIGTHGHISVGMIVKGDAPSGYAETLVNPSQLLAALPRTKDVTIDVTASAVIVDGITIPGVSVEGFPTLIADDVLVASANYADNLAAALSRVMPSASTDRYRYNINGVYFDGKNKCLVATDGHQLSTREIGLGEIDAILPLYAAKALQSLCKNQDAGTVQIFQTRRLLEFAGDSWRLKAEVIDGQYPDYKQVIPDRAAQFVSVEATGLLAAAKRLSALVDDKSRALKLTLNGNLSLSTPKDGSTIKLETSGETSPEKTVGISGVILSQFLPALKDQGVSIDIGSELEPVQFRSADLLSYTLVMPMRFE